MTFTETPLAGVLLIEPDAFHDARGFFMETWNCRRYAEHGVRADFVQDNVSHSKRGVLRGLHFQQPNAQAKLITVFDGEIFDVAVDLRDGSPTCGQWTSVVLSAENRRQLYIPEGFAHGFQVLSETAVVSYKCSRYYDPQAEGSIRWDDPDLAIRWPLASPVLSGKDAAAPLLRELPAERRFAYEAMRP